MIEFAARLLRGYIRGNGEGGPFGVCRWRAEISVGHQRRLPGGAQCRIAATWVGDKGEGREGTTDVGCKAAAEEDEEGC